MHQSAHRSWPLAAFLTLLAAVPIAAFIYIVAHGAGLEDRLLPPETAELVRMAAVQTRSKLVQLAALAGLGPCQLGDLCRIGQQRPKLPDGRESHAVWDLARKLMKDDFRDVKRILPDAKVNYIWREPLVVYYDDVLSDEDIDLLIERATPRFKKSLVVDADGNPHEDKTRTSSTGWLYAHEDERFKRVLRRVAGLSGFTDMHAEEIGINRYEPGQYFNPHHDFLKEEQLGVGEFKGCQRASTNLIYLTDVEEGGETMFARQGNMDGNFKYDPSSPDHLRIKPKRGRVLVWYDMHPFTEMIDHRTLHGGSPVTKGIKIAATIFIRNCTRPAVHPPVVPTPTHYSQAEATGAKEDL